MYETPKSRRSPLRSLEPFVMEWRLGMIGLITSLLIIAGKILYSNREEMYNFFLERQLFQTEIFTEEGDLRYVLTWKEVGRYSNIWLPVLCGVLVTYLTCLMVYLDSHVPGIQPPSPFSPTKYKTRSGHSFHLNYIFAVLVGIFLAGYMYWNGISLVF